MSILLSRIPAQADAGAGEYFLKAINTPTIIMGIRIALIIIALILIISYIYMDSTLKSEEREGE